ncbi:MAG: aldolase/citrate lyase family protein, partial [Acidimicrobiales bacterium]
LITRVLDVGAHGVMVAQIESAATATAVVAATRYGPGGTRGTAGGRGSGWGLQMSAAEYQAAANAATFVSIQVETRVGVEQIEGMAKVSGLDCLFVGLSDLSADLGVPGEWAAPELVAVLDRIETACAGENLAVGYPATDPKMAKMLLDRGARLIATADMTQLARAMTSFVTEVSAFVE